MQTRAEKQRIASRGTYEDRIEARQAPREPSALEPLHQGKYGGRVHPQAPKPLPKLTRKQKVRQDIRDSARDESCLMALPGVCLLDPAATIWSHARWPEAGKGGATKALDLNGCFACTACDAVYDGNVKMPPHLTRNEVDNCWHMAHLKSLVRLAEKGML